MPTRLYIIGPTGHIAPGGVDNVDLVVPDRTVRRSYEIVNRGTAPVSITGLDYDDEALIVRGMGVDEDGQLVVTLNPNQGRKLDVSLGLLPLGPFNISFAVLHAGGPFTWSIKGEVVADQRPVQWEEAAEHLRLDDGPNSRVARHVEMLIDAATDYAETRLGMTLVGRSRTEKFYEVRGPIALPNGPLRSITGVTDANDAPVAYSLSGADRIQITGSYTLPITVVYEAGYPSPAAVPASIRTAILAHVGTLFENRESVADKAKLPVPHSLEAFYALKARTVGIA